MMPLAQVDMFPVRVLVESVRPQLCLSCAHNGCQLLDTFAIVSGQTQLGHLVDTVLSALGLPQLIQDSRGLIQINNWKPLSFETITDNKEEPVANLFKEISSNIVLKILTKHSSTDLHNSSQCITSIKQRLLKIAMEKQPHLLTSMDNHDIKETIQQLISGEDAYNLTNETITAINEWLDQISNESSIYKNTIQATRGFNVIEIAKLEQWFLTEQNPQRPKLLNYMNTLNNSPYRRSGSKVTYQQICNWFTNQRAVLRKQQQIAHNLQQQTLNNNSGAGLAAIAVSEFQQLRNAFTTTGNEVTNSDVQMTEASSSSNGINTSTSTFLHAPTLGLMTSSGGGSPTTVGSATASTTVSAAGSTAGTTDIPIATLPVDIASKFGASNGCSALLEGSRHGHHSDGERIDGGSESPNGNDDTSVQSPSEQNAYDMDVKESGASSPTEMIIDVNVMSPSSNSLRHQSVNDIFGVFPTNTSGADPLNVGQITPATAAAAAAAMFGLASGDSVNGQNMQDFACQNGVNGAQNNQLMAAFSSLMPSLLGSGSPFNTSSNFLNGTGTTASVPPQSNSPISSTAINGSHGNGIVGNHFGGGLKATSSFFKDDGMIKQDASMNNNNNTPNNNNNNNNTARSRLMFDPLSELPVLERWFENNPHPGCLQIEQYTEKLNSCQYRQNYPPISTHNVKIWFKNRRAKCKRLNLSGNPSDTTPKSTALSV